MIIINIMLRTMLIHNNNIKTLFNNNLITLLDKTNKNMIITLINNLMITENNNLRNQFIMFFDDVSQVSQNTIIR